MIPSATLHLLNQDNTLPGNRKDGFRYHHLLFIIVATPLYLWLELSFGVRLLDNISANAADDTVAIEHWGRLISGCAVALLFLSGWVRQCEKYNILWGGRIVVGLIISVTCIILTWWGQGELIDFYIQRSNAEISLSLAVLALIVLVGFLILRAWIRYAVNSPSCPYRKLIGGLVLILIAGYLLLMTASALLPRNTERLAQERQRAATLSLVRRAIQQGYYYLEGVERDQRALESPEGRTFLALFPVFGTVLNQERFARDRPRLIAEYLYRDWDEQYGARSFEAYRELVEKIDTVAKTLYAESSKTVPGRGWEETIRAHLDGEFAPAKLSADEFRHHPSVRQYLRKQMACFDCNFNVAMDRPAFGRELFKWTQQHNVKQTVETFDSTDHFSSGRDGERAARAYWVPIWALLFSMIGGFTHMFKMIFTVTEYAHRLTFNQVKAADSVLADRVIANSRLVTAAVVVGMALFIYFADNRITAHERYVEMRERMWRTSPIVGALAAHWTVNAQGFIYPFTRKIRPHWLGFNEDPLAKIPGLARLINADEY